MIFNVVLTNEAEDDLEKLRSSGQKAEIRKIEKLLVWDIINSMQCIFLHAFIVCRLLHIHNLNCSISSSELGQFLHV